MAEADSIAIGRHCSICGQFKQADQFNKSRRAKDGLTNRCRPCQAAYCVAYKKAGGVRKSHAQRRAEKLSADDKLCPKCQTRKPKDEFGKSLDRTDGLRPWCKICHNACNKKWRQENPEAQNRATRDWERRNPDRVRAKNLRFKQSNPARFSELQARWRANNRDRALEIQRKSVRKSRTSISGKLRYRVSNSVRSSLVRGKGGMTTFDLLGYTLGELFSHLERQFTKGMSWDKFRSGMIHIDHILPLSSFNIQSHDSASFRQAWALSNLRPIWAQENLRKSSKRLFLI